MTLMMIHVCGEHLLKAFSMSSTIQVTKKIKMNDLFLFPRKLTVIWGVRVRGELGDICRLTNYYRPNDRDGNGA